MRQVGQNAYKDLTMPPGAEIEVVKVAGDGTVTNADITKLADKLDSLGADVGSSSSSRCVLDHVES